MTAHLCSICQLPVIAAGKLACTVLMQREKQASPMCSTTMQQTGNQQRIARHVLHLSHTPQQMCVVMLAGLEQAGRMRSGETVLVTAAAGGTGQFAVQLAKLAGNQVVATCGSDDKAQLLTDLGCHRVINYNKEQPKVVHFKLNPSKNSSRMYVRLSGYRSAEDLVQPCSVAHTSSAVLLIAFVPWQSAATLQD